MVSWPAVSALTVSDCSSKTGSCTAKSVTAYEYPVACEHGKRIVIICDDGSPA